MSLNFLRPDSFIPAFPSILHYYLALNFEQSSLSMLHIVTNHEHRFYDGPFGTFGMF